MSVAGVGGKIIAVQGEELGNISDSSSTRIYDIATNVWTFGARAPFASAEGTAVSKGGLLYALGGRNGIPFPVPEGPRADLISYDIVSNSWTVLASMPTARAGLGAAVDGNAIYAIGGRSGINGPASGRALDVVERYDISTNTWTTVAPLPFPRSDCAAIAENGKIFVFGGFSSGGAALNNVDEYYPRTNMWRPRNPMPTARGAFSQVAKIRGVIYAIGGTALTGDNGLTTNEAYNPAMNLWAPGQLPMPKGEDEAGVVNHKGMIYIIGGSKPALGSSGFGANQAFKP